MTGKMNQTQINRLKKGNIFKWLEMKDTQVINVGINVGFTVGINVGSIVGINSNQPKARSYKAS